MLKDLLGFNSMSSRGKKRTVKRLTTILIIFAVIIVLMIISFKSNKTNDIKYSENGNVDYTVNLSKNDFFEDESLPANNQYIASIIDSVNANFKYNFKIDNEFSDYSYKYRIEEETKVVDKTTKNDIYKFNDTVKEEETVNPENNEFSINSNITVDYKKYNSLIKKLVSTYNLDGVECSTAVKFYVDLLDENGNIKNTSTMGINIPLNVKTVNIEYENNIDESESKIFIAGTKENNNLIFVKIAVILFIINIFNIVKLVKDIKRSFSPEVIDDIKLKKILRNYKPYIQKVNSEFDISKYNIMEVDSFEDMLEIREITQNPILMVENEDKTKMYFVITTLTTILYVYEVGQSNIKALSEGK